MSSVSGYENNAASTTPDKVLASEGLFEVLGTGTALQQWDVCSMNKHMFGYCLSGADICPYLLSLQECGWNKLCEEGLLVILELMGTEAEPILRCVHVHNDKLWSQMCVLYGCLVFALSISQLLHRFARNSFPRSVVADTRALKSCKD